MKNLRFLNLYLSIYFFNFQYFWLKNRLFSLWDQKLTKRRYIFLDKLFILFLLKCAFLGYFINYDVEVLKGFIYVNFTVFIQGIKLFINCYGFYLKLFRFHHSAYLIICIFRKIYNAIYSWTFSEALVSGWLICHYGKK